MPIVVAMAWVYVVLLVALAEATSADGSLLGAALTIVGWGVVPLSIVLYIVNRPARRSLARRASATDPGHADHAAGDAVAPEREEP